MRIVSLAPSNTEILYALGCEEMIVACTRYCDFPADALHKPRIGGWLDVNDELVAQYKPDIVMTSTFVQDKIVSRYQERGITLFHTDPKTLEQVYESIVAIGKLVDKVGKAGQLVDSMKKEFREIENATTENPNDENPTGGKRIMMGQLDHGKNNTGKSLGNEHNDKTQDNNRKSTDGKPKETRIGKRRVYCEEWHKPPTVSGNWVPKVIEIAGGESLCPEGKISYPVTLEDVTFFDPDCIIISICGMGAKASPELIAKREGWDRLRAVREGNIHVIDDSLLNRPGPRLVDGAKELSAFFRRLG